MRFCAKTKALACILRRREMQFQPVPVEGSDSSLRMPISASHDLIYFIKMPSCQTQCYSGPDWPACEILFSLPRTRLGIVSQIHGLHMKATPWYSYLIVCRIPKWLLHARERSSFLPRPTYLPSCSLAFSPQYDVVVRSREIAHS
jgi:hypothetical protein